MQDNPAPRKPGYPGRVYPPRQCADCGTVFTSRSSSSRRCEDCQYRRNLKKSRESQERRRRAAYKPRYCADCGVELPPPNGSARPRVRCVPCAEVHKTAHNRERNKERTESGGRKVYDRRYREGSRETIQANNRKYKRAHPEADEASNARRRSRLKARMTPEDRRLSRLFRKVSRRFPCFYCGAPAPDGKSHELEHYFPISKFGTDHFWNLLRACRACNRGAGGKGQVCGTAFLLRRITPGADWPHPPHLEGFPPLPATGILFPKAAEAAALAREPLRLF